MTQERVTTVINANIAEICFYSEKANSLSKKVLSEVSAKIRDLSRDETCKVILLASEGDKTFCAGASFDEFKKVKTEKEAAEYLMGIGNLIIEIKNCPKLVVAKVQGKVVGGGLGLVAACDYSIACKEASVRLSEVALGIGPFIIEPILKRKMGLANTSNMTFDSEWRTADWALKAGLFSRVVSSQDELSKQTDDYLQFIAEKHSDTISELKEIFWSDSQNLEKELQARAQATAKYVLKYFA